MRSRFLLLIGLFTLSACQDRKTDVAPTPPPTVPAGPQGATSQGQAAAPAALQGSISGKPFVPDNIIFEGRSLSFRKGKEFFPVMEIKFDVPAGKLEGKEWKFDGNKFENPTVIVGGKNMQSTFLFPKDYTLTLKITKETSKAIEGIVDLHAKVSAIAQLQGPFSATRKKTADDPLEADDAPYVHGKIAFVGPWKQENLSAGFVGKGTDGKQHSNMAGATLSPDTGGNTTSMTFQPQLTSLTGDNKGTLTYRHTRMAPGEYLVYVKRNKVMAAWQKVTLKAGDQLTIDLTIDPAKTGEVVVTLPEDEANDKSDWPLSLQPAGLYMSGSEFSYAFNAAAVKAGQKTVTVVGVPAGKYQVSRGKSRGEVEVAAGKSTAVTLVRDEPKTK